MATWSYSFRTLIIAIFAVLLTEVSAYYCDHDLCATDQYCCGDNLCCDYVYSLWYFWVGVAFLVLVISAGGAFYRYFYDSKRYIVVPYFQPWSDQKQQSQCFVKDLENDSMPEHSDYIPPNRKGENKMHPSYKLDSGMRSSY